MNYMEWNFSNWFSVHFVGVVVIIAINIKQSQLDDKDRTIRIQQNLISKLEAEMDQVNTGKNCMQSDQMIDTVNIATQTDRVSSH